MRLFRGKYLIIQVNFTIKEKVHLRNLKIYTIRFQKNNKKRGTNFQLTPFVYKQCLMTKRGDIYLYVCGLDDLFIVYILDAI